jgi:hypothetical protein
MDLLSAPEQVYALLGGFFDRCWVELRVILEDLYGLLALFPLNDQGFGLADVSFVGYICGTDDDVLAVYAPLD